MAVDATGTFLTNQAALELMREGGGRIINFASAAGAKGLPGKAAYAASKAAVLAWTRTIAVEWAFAAVHHSVRHGCVTRSDPNGVRK